MTGFSQILAMSVFLCLVSAPGRAEEPVQEATLRVQTRVYNMAKVRPIVLSGALIEASEIFQRIGVEVEWVEGSSPQRFGSCQLYLRIIPRLFPNTRYALGPSHLGYAATSEEGGVLATIFFTVSKNWLGETPRMLWVAPSPTNWVTCCLAMIGGTKALIQRVASCAAPGNETT